MTLVELSIVLAIVGGLAAMALPGILRWRQSLDLRRASSEISAALMQARSRAIFERRYIRVTFNPTAETFTTSTYLDPAMTTLLSTAPNTADPWKGVDIYQDDTDAACPTFTGWNIDFRPNSTADATGYEGVYLRNADVSQRYRVKVLGATGKITVERWLGAAWGSAF